MNLNQCYIGDCRTLLAQMAAAGVRAQTCVTSPPYWGLRDYGVDGQIGLEPTLAEWVDTMVDVFRAVRDVLADDGTVWLNLGDGYATAGGPGWQGKNGQRADRRFTAPNMKPKASEYGFKPKDLLGQPWRVAFALQDDGWYLRQDIIWHKPNPMPESVTDRCTKAHEYVFLLSKTERYYCDMESIKEQASNNTHARKATIKKPDGWDTGPGAHGTFHRGGREKGKTGLNPKAAGVEQGQGIKQNESFSAAVTEVVDERNKRSVWTVPSEPFADAHFATYPTGLIEPCVLAGSRKGDVVLDPFMGSGTTAQVAEHLGRQWIGCELQPDYLPLQSQRLSQRAMAL